MAQRPIYPIPGPLRSTQNRSRIFTVSGGPADNTIIVPPASATANTSTHVATTVCVPPVATASTGGSNTGYKFEVLADSPAAYWRLGEPSGTNANDEIGTNDGTYTNTPTLSVTGAITGSTDTAVTFDGAQSEDVTMGAVSVGTNFTMEAWFKTTAATGRIISVNNSATNAHLSIGMSGTRFVADSHSNSGGNVFLDGPFGKDDGNWHHAVLTKTNLALELWLDGVSVATGTMDTGVTTDQFSLAREAGGAPAYFTGSLDEAAYYTTALTGTRITAHWDARTVTEGAGGGQVHTVKITSLPNASAATGNTTTEITSVAVTSSAGAATANTTTDVPEVKIISPPASATANTSTHTISLSITLTTTAGAATANTTTDIPVVTSLPTVASATADATTHTSVVTVISPAASATGNTTTHALSISATITATAAEATANTSTHVPVVTITSDVASSTANTSTHVATAVAIPSAASATANTETDVPEVRINSPPSLTTANTTDHIVSVTGSTVVVADAASATANTSTHIPVITSTPSAGLVTGSTSTDTPSITVISAAGNATANTSTHASVVTVTTTAASATALAVAPTVNITNDLTIVTSAALATANTSTHTTVVTIFPSAASSTASTANPTTEIRIFAPWAPSTAFGGSVTITGISIWNPHTINLVTVTSLFRTGTIVDPYVGSTVIGGRIAKSNIDLFTTLTHVDVVVDLQTTNSYVALTGVPRVLTVVIVDKFSSMAPGFIPIQLAPFPVVIDKTVIDSYTGRSIVPVFSTLTSTPGYKSIGNPPSPIETTQQDKVVNMTIIGLISSRVFIVP